MSNYDETKHKRIGDGTFTNKDQSAPELSLTAGKYANSTPVECDTELADLYNKRSLPASYFARGAERLRKHEREMEYRAENEGRARNRHDAIHERDLARLEQNQEQYRVQLEEFDALIEPIVDEYQARGRWSRFFLVRNSGGHIHSSMHCSTCYPTTSFVWLPDRSGSDEAETVAMAGDAACTVCFPSAPVADKAHPRPNQLETADVLAARAAKIAAKEAKATKERLTGIWGPDGEELREGSLPGDSYRGQLIKTERSAEIKVVDLIVSKLARARRYANDPGRGTQELSDYDIRDQMTYDSIVEALATKRGQSIEEVRAFIQDKAEKKFKKEYR